MHDIGDDVIHGELHQFRFYTVKVGDTGTIIRADCSLFDVETMYGPAVSVRPFVAGEEEPEFRVTVRSPKEWSYHGWSFLT